MNLEERWESDPAPARWGAYAPRHYKVIDYCAEEVRRQGHDLSVLDSIQRVGWMLDAWSYALAHDPAKPAKADILILGAMVERDVNAGGFREVAVRVGNRGCPPAGNVPYLIEELMTIRDELSPLGFYHHFEMIHPFVDGNGRTGKVLLNWLNGSLYSPVFPPPDFWGERIENP